MLTAVKGTFFPFSFFDLHIDYIVVVTYDIQQQFPKLLGLVKWVLISTKHCTIFKTSMGKELSAS